MAVPLKFCLLVYEVCIKSHASFHNLLVCTKEKTFRCNLQGIANLFGMKVYLRLICKPHSHQSLKLQRGISMYFSPLFPILNKSYAPVVTIYYILSVIKGAYPVVFFCKIYYTPLFPTPNTYTYTAVPPALFTDILL